MAQIVELIFTEERIGTGKKDDVVRLCQQLWTKDGQLVGNYDPCDPERTYFKYPPLSLIKP